MNRLIVLEEVGLVHEIVGRIAIILSRIDGHIEGEIVSGAVEAGSKVDRVQLGHAVPTVVGHLAQFAVETGIEVGGGIYDVGTDLGGGIGVRLPCGDQHVGYVAGLSAEVVDCQRHVELAIDLNGLVSAVGGLKDDVLRGALIAFQLLIADGVGAGNVGFTLFVVDPAAFVENRVSGVGAVSILVQYDFVLNGLVGGEAGVVRTMHNGAEAAGEGLRKLGTVDGVADGLTHFGKGGVGPRSQRKPSLP